MAFCNRADVHLAGVNLLFQGGNIGGTLRHLGRRRLLLLGILALQLVVLFPAHCICPPARRICPVRRSPRGGQKPRRAGAGRSVADPRSSWCDLPVGAGQQTRRPRQRLPRDIAKLMLCWTQHSTRTPLRIGKRASITAAAMRLCSFTAYDVEPPISESLWHGACQIVKRIS